MLDQIKEAIIRDAIPVALGFLLDRTIHRHTFDVTRDAEGELVALIVDFTGVGEPPLARRIEIVIHDGRWPALYAMGVQTWRRLAAAERKAARREARRA